MMNGLNILFMRKNIKGVQFERWNHAHGCRKWFKWLEILLMMKLN